MSTFWMLHRPRHQERIFRSTKALVAAAVPDEGAPNMGHFDFRGRILEGVEALPVDGWFRINDVYQAHRFEANERDIEQTIEG